MTAITGKKSAFGAILKAEAIAGDIAGVFRNIANIAKIKGPGLSLDTVDITSHDSTGAWEEVAATILRTGEMTLDMLYDPSAVSIKRVDGLIGRMVDKLPVNFKMYFNDDTVEASRTIWIFTALVTGFEPDLPVDGALAASMKLKISGVPTIV